MVLAVVIVMLLFLFLSAAGVLVESVQPDELRSMGVARRPESQDARSRSAGD